jgi:hypothetical protein
MVFVRLNERAFNWAFKWSWDTIPCGGSLFVRGSAVDGLIRGKGFLVDFSNFLLISGRLVITYDTIGVVGATVMNCAYM